MGETGMKTVVHTFENDSNKNIFWHLATVCEMKIKKKLFFFNNQSQEFLRFRFKRFRELLPHLFRCKQMFLIYFVFVFEVVN